MITARKTVARAKAYAAPTEGRRNFVRLDFNENTKGINTIREEFGDVGNYPEYQDLINKLALNFNLPEENLMLTNGSSEGIFLTAFSFIEPGECRALTTKPTFALIPQYLRLTGAYLIEIEDSKELQFDLKKTETALKLNIKVAMFASPNNPTGAVLPSERVTAWCNKFPDTLFVIDEAYIDYGGESLLSMVTEVNNLIVLRTFSKAWGIAGLRLGVLAGAKELLDEIKKVKAPYSVNSQAVNAALKLLNRQAEISAQVKRIVNLREQLAKDISTFGYKTIFGQGNFFLLGAGIDAEGLTEFCKTERVLVRNQTSSELVRGYIRVTIGTEEECQQFINCLDQYKKSSALIFDLDDTLVDTSTSYDQTVLEMVSRYTGAALTRKELIQLRLEGGFNDDWIAIQELCQRKGVQIPLEKITSEARSYYLSIARKNESPLIEKELLLSLSKRYRLFILTGRYREEYEPVWAELDKLFEQVYCINDFRKEAPKPSGDMLNTIIETNQLQAASYIGNSVDDVAAAKAAGIRAIGITSNMPEEALYRAGADIIATEINDLRRMFLL